MVQEITEEERFFNLRKDPLQIPGPIDPNNASHWVEFDHENHTVETWCSFGPERQFRLKQRVRPMVEAEIIMSKLRNYTWQDVLLAFGVDETRIAKADPSTGSNTEAIIKAAEGHDGKEVLRSYGVTGEIPDVTSIKQSPRSHGIIGKIGMWFGQKH